MIDYTISMMIGVVLTMDTAISRTNVASMFHAVLRDGAFRFLARGMACELSILRMRRQIYGR